MAFRFAINCSWVMLNFTTALMLDVFIKVSRAMSAENAEIRVSICPVTQLSVLSINSVIEIPLEVYK